MNDEVIDRIAERLAQKLRTPNEVDLWKIEDVAQYLKYDYEVTRDRIVHLPTFPKPIRVTGRSQARYKACQVIAWAESHQSK